MTVNFYNGEIADAASSVSELIRVSVPNLNMIGRRTYGPFPFRPHLGDAGAVVMPTLGDRALVAVDTDGGDAWIVEWQGNTAGSPIGGPPLYEQPNEPAVQPVGTIWVDTDASPQRDPLPTVTTLPSGAMHGEEVYLRAPGSGAAAVDPNWHMRFDLSMNKWQWIGGQEHLRNPTGGTYTLGSAWQQMTGEHEWIIPFTGTYQLTVGMTATGTSGTNPVIQLIWALHNSGGTYLGAAGALLSMGVANAITYKYAGIGDILTLGAGGNKLRFLVTAPEQAGSAAISSPWIRVRPVRLDAA
jgi:hypothetical protein